MRRVSRVPLAVHADTARCLKCKLNKLYMMSTGYQLVLSAEHILRVDTDCSLGKYSLV